ncbi:MAG: VWA domain-containing protein [Chitinophagaceae bacterium]|nr:MAG: VWA domain-containing protein [Chitinophagaceae bacterium]
MQPKHNALLCGLLLLALPLVFSFTPRRTASTTRPPAPKIQVAILLDVSSSMDGLIDQAKAQLWNLVGLLGRAECDRGTPQVEIALYEYGRTSNDAAQGYVKRIHSFTRELDSLSKSLFALNTNGGEEYCPQVIYTSVQDLPWDSDPKTYKALFIAGNESFRQGSLTWEKACAAARAKGIVVNTIYCGDKAEGIREFWNLNAECGSGSYSNINSNAQAEDIPTPYDSALYTLNDQFNVTMVGYGVRGRAAGVQVAEVDRINYEHNKASAAARATVKAQRGLYNNASWDIVDAYEADSNFHKTVDRSSLPDSLQQKTAAQLKVVIERKRAERDQVRGQIAEISRKRGEWLTEERKRRATRGAEEATLESEMEKVLKVQVQRNGFVIK